MDRTTRNSKKKRTIRELTNKERFLIALLAIVVLTWASFKYVIDPQTEEIAELESEKEFYMAEINENNRILKNRDEILETRNLLEIEKEAIEKDFFKSLNQPRIIYTLNELLLESDIEMESISFIEPFYEIIDDEEIEKMDISIPFEGAFEDLAQIIKEIEKEPKKIMLSSLDMSTSEESEISGSINLAIFSLTGLVDGVEDDTIIRITDDNKENPFIPYGGYVDPDLIVEEDDDYDDDDYDDEDQESDDDVDVSDQDSDDEKVNSEDQALDGRDYRLYKAVKGDHITSISRSVYGDDSYVDEILKINGMLRSNVLPIGKVLKLIER